MTKTTMTGYCIALLVLLAGLLTGCEEQMGFQSKGENHNPFQPSKPVEPVKADYVQDETLAEDHDDSNRGATDVAMEWADKYAKVAQELLFANKRIADLEREKKKSQTQIAALKAELEGYQRELNDANAMLNDMKRDLKEWRANVLGIRREFMSSQNAILASQQKILELLGGEVSAGAYQRTHRASQAPATPQASRTATKANYTSN